MLMTAGLKCVSGPASPYGHAPTVCAVRSGTRVDVSEQPKYPVVVARSLSDFTTSDRLHFSSTHRSAFAITHVVSHKPSIH